MTITNIPIIEYIELITARVPRCRKWSWGDQIHHVTDIEVAIVDVHASNGLMGTGFRHTSGWCGATISALIKEIIIPDIIGQRLCRCARCGIAAVINTFMMLVGRV